MTQPAFKEMMRDPDAWTIIEDCATRDEQGWVTHCLRNGKILYTRARSVEASRRLGWAGYALRAYPCEHFDTYQGHHFHLTSKGAKAPKGKKRGTRPTVEPLRKAFVYQRDQFAWVFDCPFHPEMDDGVMTTEPMASQHRAYARLMRHLRRSHQIII